MPYLYVYSPDDFVQGLPDEHGAKAYGSGGFQLTLKADAEPTIVEINDNDLVFDEVDSSQHIAETVTIDGETVTGGTTIHSAYDLINTGSGHKVTSFHFGGDGYQQGPVDGIASTEVMTPGQTYHFNYERTSHQQNNQYTDFVSCFVAGSRILAETGEVPVEDLRPGDRVITADHGPQPLRAVLRRPVRAAELARSRDLRPVRIAAGALGQGLPARDLRVSPQHRLLVRSQIAARMFGIPEALVSARKLIGLPGIAPCSGADGIVYLHLVLDRHEVIFADGAPTESLYLGPGALASLTEAARDELLAVFPDLQTEAPAPKCARLIPAGRLQSRLCFRHGKNGKPLLETPGP
ncbi:Hint domain-containing protein [Dinoroseobacter sp. S76]|uniref:Hint domain-containing protein n=1 Tax=Dinoroseobacter sp. S76 TaxID=3415124 RepID=UPI003C7D1D9E